jgi:hypothetical protein
MRFIDGVVLILLARLLPERSDVGIDELACAHQQRMGVGSRVSMAGLGSWIEWRERIDFGGIDAAHPWALIVRAAGDVRARMRTRSSK